MTSRPKPTTPDDYKPKRGGAPSTWNPKITVRIRMTPEDAAYYKARMDERLSEEKK